jgi:hypothetical protein
VRSLLGLVLLLILAPATALAKEGPRTLLICGADACREDRGAAWRQASTIDMRSHRGPVHGGVFFEVAFLDGRGVPTSPAALRYVPELRATRAARAGGPAWFRARPALVRELDKLTKGLAPRSASALTDPPGWPVAYAVPNTEAPEEVSRVAWVWFAVAGLVVMLGAAAARSRRRPRAVEPI